MTITSSFDESAVSSRVEGWLAVWQLGAAGECACPRWWRCDHPGKHPAPPSEHGVLSAVSDPGQIELSGRTRLGAVPGDRLLVIDLDSDAAWRVFVRYVSGCVVPIAVAKTPRGWHVYVEMSTGGWEPGAVNHWLRQWLGKRAGGLLEVRIGSRGYVVWPGSGGRSWVDLGEFAAKCVRSFVDVPAYGVAAAWGPPWDAGDDTVIEGKPLAVWQTGKSVPWSAPVAGEVLGAETAAERLDLACQRLVVVSPGGRNNRLNLAAFWQGADAVAAGLGEGEVAAALMAAGSLAGLGTGEIRATVLSGLRGGRKRYPS